MATSKITQNFKCPCCKKEGQVVIAESDHPYNTETWVDEVTDGFSAENLHQFSVTIRCLKCNELIA